MQCGEVAGDEQATGRNDPLAQEARCPIEQDQVETIARDDPAKAGEEAGDRRARLVRRCCRHQNAEIDVAFGSRMATRIRAEQVGELHHRLRVQRRCERRRNRVGIEAAHDSKPSTLARISHQVLVEDEEGPSVNAVTNVRRVAAFPISVGSS